MHLAKISAALVLACCLAYTTEAASLKTIWSHIFGEDVFQWPPTFCEDIECPRYTVIDHNEEYEIRQYNPSRWATTSMQGRNYHTVFHSMFMKLYQYITGNNIRQSRITMTVPVLTRVTPCNDEYACESEFQMSFFMSAESGRQPPVPTYNSQVSLTNMPEMDVYVASFSGSASQRDFEQHVDHLIQLLPEDSVDTSHYYCVTYDTPYTNPQNYNEVWLVALSTDYDYEI